MTDTWDDEPLSDARIVRENEPIHYRIHAVDGGKLLAFGTASGGGYLQIAGHYREVQAANPGRHLVLRRYDKPAGPQFDYMMGPGAGRR